ncbi:MAG: ParB/RepB/Spo0J family partition protein [Lachnospiraceae bacterium]|nr:ParB/RepB/Spo0J family partition protein [Lachnospiraceae bacterium]
MGLRARSDVYVNLPVEKLHPHPDNPRKDLGDLTELSESIKKNGIMQNLTVIPDGEGYKILIGHRRCAAAKLAGLKELPCRIAIGLDDREQQLIMLEENMERRDLTVWEQAESFQMVLDLGGSVQDIAEKTGFSKSTVYHRLQIAKLPKEAVKKATEGENSFQMSITDFIELEKVSDLKKREQILENAFSPRDLKSRVDMVVEQEKRDKARENIEFMLETLGVKRAPKGTENQVWGSKWQQVKTFNLNQPVPKEIDMTGLEGTVYASSNYTVYVLKRAEKKKEDSESELRAKEITRRCKEMKKIQDRMTEDRERWILNMVTEGENLKDINKQNEAYRLCWKTLYEVGCFVRDGVIERFLSRAMWDEDYYGLKEEDQDKLRQMTRDMEMGLQMLIFASEELKDTKSSSTVLWISYKAGYNEDAGRVHRMMLETMNAFGKFKYDAEEMELINGTHELYMKEEPDEG